MRIKINFKPNTKPLTTPVDDYLNGFIHKCLGPNNKWHDAFSPYSVSQMQGGVLIDGMIQYPNGGYCVVSSNNKEFISDFLEGIVNLDAGSVQTMEFKNFTTYSPELQKYFDMVRIECVRLVEDGKPLTFKNDESFLEKLREESVRKLKKCGIRDKDAESIELIPFHMENWREKYRKLKNNGERPAVVPTSNIMIILKGSRTAREALNLLGYGQSTGYGFGFARLACDNMQKQ